MRNTPVIVFINKMDLEGRDPTDLLDEVEAKLNIQVRPLSWPISQGHTFQGVYNLYNKSLRLFQADKTKVAKDVVAIDSLDDSQLDDLVGNHAEQLREDVELIEGVYDAWDPKPYLEGKMAPVFFGSAVNNFGVQEMLDTFVDIAPNPKPRETSTRMVPRTKPNSRGSSSRSTRTSTPSTATASHSCACALGTSNATPYQHTRLDKKLKFANPASFLAQEKSVVEQAWPGDVVGLYDTGNFKIGDTLTEGEDLQFQGHPETFLGNLQGAREQRPHEEQATRQRHSAVDR